jgi:hypothetical protein
MHYARSTSATLTRWFRVSRHGAGSGTQANTGGYSVYFSDRRNNRDDGSAETGEYGFEDFVNPANASGAANATLDAGEDVNANWTLDVYGEFPNYNGVASALPPGAAAPYNAAARPWTAINAPGASVPARVEADQRRPGKYHRPGFTVVSENPVYAGRLEHPVGCSNTDGDVATPVVADAVTRCRISG